MSTPPTGFNVFGYLGSPGGDNGGGYNQIASTTAQQADLEAILLYQVRALRADIWHLYGR